VIDEVLDDDYDGRLVEDEWLTTTEVMDLLKVSRQTLANWRQQNKVTAYRLGVTRGVRYKKSELEDLISEAQSIRRI